MTALKQELNTGEITLNPTEAKDLIVGSYKAGFQVYKRPLLFKGAPGIGKSSIARQAADELGIDYIEINPTMPADEVCGIPDLIRVEGHATKTDYALPAWFPTEADNPEWKGIINFDDALQGDKMMQQTLANLIHARNLRGHPMPKGAMIVVTGNRMEDKAGVTKTLTHFADRMCHINVEADPQAWIDDYAIPNNIDSRVLAYIMNDKAKLNVFNPNATKGPTSRTWDAVSNRLIHVDMMPSKSRTKLAQATLSGELGVGEAVSFWAFCERYADMPNLDEILKNPDTADINHKLDIKYAIACALSSRVDNTTFASAMTYLDRIGGDLSVLLAKLAGKRSPALLKSRAWIDWAMKNQDLIATSGPSR